jgi:hypothetical protein
MVYRPVLARDRRFSFSWMDWDKRLKNMSEAENGHPERIDRKESLFMDGGRI